MIGFIPYEKGKVKISTNHDFRLAFFQQLFIF